MSGSRSALQKLVLNEKKRQWKLASFVQYRKLQPKIKITQVGLSNCYP